MSVKCQRLKDFPDKRCSPSDQAWPPARRQRRRREAPALPLRILADNLSGTLLSKINLDQLQGPCKVGCEC